MVGIGGAVEGIGRMSDCIELREYDITIGSYSQVKLLAGERTHSSAGLEFGRSWNSRPGRGRRELSPRANGGVIHLFPNNQTASTTCRAPNRRTGQASVDKIFNRVKHLKESGNRVIAWTPVDSIFDLGQRAKRLAGQSTDEERVVQERVRLIKKTVRNTQVRLMGGALRVSTTFGEAVRRNDVPGLAVTPSACRAEKNPSIYPSNFR